MIINVRDIVLNVRMCELNDGVIFNSIYKSNGRYMYEMRMGQK